MFTIQKIAATLNVTQAEAYGLVHFLTLKGVLAVTKVRTGKAGKPANLYSFADSPANSVNGALRPLYLACLTNMMQPEVTVFVEEQTEAQFDATVSTEIAQVEAWTAQG